MCFSLFPSTSSQLQFLLRPLLNKYWACLLISSGVGLITRRNITGLFLENLSYPIEEGGIGTLHLTGVCIALQFKQWWVFRTKETLGGDFLRAKYCQRAHPVIKKWHTSKSLSWKHMMRNKQLAETHIHWRLKSGTCSFGWDDWLGIGPLHYYGGDPMRSNNMKVYQLWIQGEWDVERL